MGVVISNIFRTEESYFQCDSYASMTRRIDWKLLELLLSAFGSFQHRVYMEWIPKDMTNPNFEYNCLYHAIVNSKYFEQISYFSCYTLPPEKRFVNINIRKVRQISPAFADSYHQFAIKLDGSHVTRRQDS